jgi:hypothetical protein
MRDFGVLIFLSQSHQSESSSFAFEIVCNYSTIPTNEFFKLGFDPCPVRPRHEGIAEATKDTSAVSCALRRLRPFDHLVHSGEDLKEIAGSTRIFSDLTGDPLRGTYEER